MKTYNNIKKVNKDIKDGVLKVDDDIEIAFDGFEIDANIECKNIYSKGYRRDINALNIKASDILYYAVCFAYENIKCKSIEGRRVNSKHFCLDGEITSEKSHILPKNLENKEY